VLLQDAHTWVEVYFPDYGWVEFEPTAAQPAIVRPAEPESIASPDQGLNDAGQDLASDLDRMDRMEELLDQGVPPDTGYVGPFPWSNLDPAKPGSWVFGGLVLLLLAGVVVWTMRNRRSVRLSGVGSIYHNMVRLAGWAGAPTYLSQTPDEHASALARIVPEGERPARRIAGLYARERYGNRVPDDREQATASQDWRELRPRLVRRTILRRVLGRGRK